MPDQVRARAASTRKLGNGGKTKHTLVEVGALAEVEFTCDAKCTQVSIANDPTSAGLLYMRLDATAVTTANGFPVAGQAWDVEGGTVIRLISDTAAQQVRVMEALLG